MASLDTVMQRLEAHTRKLQERPVAVRPQGDEDKVLMAESLALVSEALLRIGRDVRQLRLQMADRQ